MKLLLTRSMAILAVLASILVAAPANAQVDNDDGEPFVVVEGEAPASGPEEGAESVDESDPTVVAGDVDGIDVTPLVAAADDARDAGDQAAFDAAVAELAAVDQAVADAQQHDWDEAQAAPTAPPAGGVNVQAVGIFGDPLGCVYTSIQDAIDAASPGDSIVVEPDT